ncbi:hypothetical protein CEXT_122131 [Caerostris extrusa]|uniref:Uncharacterized protein n=1 Tax=Caerostris extrusa TaxID=172846 RepID=A0AAV4QMQ2_CAEEX|nr:hypothetical protein CEXT_122131 [Caerostris extrusa]
MLCHNCVRIMDTSDKLSFFQNMECFNHPTLTSSHIHTESSFAPPVLCSSKPSANKRTSSVALKRSIAAFRRSFYLRGEADNGPIYIRLSTGG